MQWGRDKKKVGTVHGGDLSDIFSERRRGEYHFQHTD
jgi:hypothetical protein